MSSQVCVRSVIMSFPVSQVAFGEESPGTSQKDKLGEAAAGQTQGEVSQHERFFSYITPLILLLFQSNYMKCQV